MALDSFNPYLFVSAGEQSNKFLTPTYADGIAQFQAQRAQELTGLTVRIDPIQEGTGDPSPTNIRPISGRTGMKVDASAINIWDEQTTVGGYYDSTGAWRTDSSILGCANAIPVRPGMQLYCYSANNAAVYISLFSRMVTIGTSATDAFISRTRRENQSFTIPDGVECMYFNFASTYGSTYKNDVSINYPSSEQTMNLAGRIIPIDWQTQAGTVYGGTLDVVSGVLTVTHAYKEYTGQTSETWTESSWTKTNTYVAYSNVDLPNSKKEGSRYMCITACNMLPLMGYDELRNADTNGITITGGLTASYPSVRIAKTVASTVAELQTYLASNPLTIVYELATPQTYQLTPTQVRTIAGYNQIYSDAGPVIDIKF